MTSETKVKLEEFMRKLQPDANKKDKKAAYKEILTFLNNNDLDEDDNTLLFSGDGDRKLLGLCELAGKKISTGKFKDSAKNILGIIHDLMYLSKKLAKYREEFVINEESIQQIQLGDHYLNFRKIEPSYAKKVIEVIELTLSEFSDNLRILEAN